MEEIIKIVDNCLKKLEKDYKMDKEDIITTYYNIYLTSLGIRNGTYIEIFKFGKLEKFIKSKKIKNEYEFIKYITNIFDDLKKIKNINLYVGKLYDSSFFRDTLYIYYEPNKQKIFKVIKQVEAIDRNKKKEVNKLQSKIAFLLGYEPINYSNIENFINICFKSNNICIFSYYITKNKLNKTYERLLKIQKYFPDCILEINNNY